jgi:precorrin-6B methylase 1
MGEINVIFRGSMSIASKTQGMKFEQEISSAQRIEPRRKMKWSNVDISFRPEDHLEIELSQRNLTFVVKLPIGRHKVAKTLFNNGASLNLIKKKPSSRWASI